MPGRWLREGILESARIEALVRDTGWPAEVFYRRLFSVVDDFGRFYARPDILKGKCYPTLLELVREADIQRWIAACETAGLVRLYEDKGTKYLEIIDFKQKMRTKTGSKFPPPPDVGRMSDICPTSVGQMSTVSVSVSKSITADKPPDDGPNEKLETEVSKLIGEMPFAGNCGAKDRSIIIKLVEQHGVDETRKMLLEAVKNGAGRPASYAQTIATSRQAKAQLKRENAPKHVSAVAVREDN